MSELLHSAGRHERPGPRSPEGCGRSCPVAALEPTPRFDAGSALLNLGAGSHPASRIVDLSMPAENRRAIEARGGVAAAIASVHR